MLTFSAYLTEMKSDLFSKIEKIISPHTMSILKKTGTTTTVVIRAPAADRKSVKADVEKKLAAAGVSFKSVRAGGSTGATDITDSPKIRITYKPESGGMSETTLNSTITELAPALAFMANKKFSDVDKFYKFVKSTIGNKNKYGVYVKTDEEAGIDFINSMPSSSKFNEKFENAIAILNYLHDEHKKSPIEQVWWGYRAKPPGIDASHKGDLFIKYTTGEMIGVSLKAGGEKTAEPQLNTYVNKLFDDFDRSTEKETLKKEVYEKIHSTIGLPNNWENTSQKSAAIDLIQNYKSKYPKKYEEKYDEMLEIIRNAIIKNVNKNMNDTIAYIRKQVIKKDDNVPLVVVKAFNKTYKFVTDEDALETFLPKVKRIKAYASDSSKQNWHIDLIASSRETITMNMTVRTNKTEPNNKIAQGFNLAIKFNGLKK